MEKLLLWVTNRLVTTDTLKKEMKRSRRFWTIICLVALACAILGALVSQIFYQKGLMTLIFYLYWLIYLLIFLMPAILIGILNRCNTPFNPTNEEIKVRQTSRVNRLSILYAVPLGVISVLEWAIRYLNPKWAELLDIHDNHFMLNLPLFTAVIAIVFLQHRWRSALKNGNTGQ